MIGNLAASLVLVSRGLACFFEGIWVGLFLLGRHFFLGWGRTASSHQFRAENIEAASG